MKRIVTIVLSAAVLIAGSVFIVRSLGRSSAPPEVARPPDLSRAPARVYGKVEPAGREVYVTAPLTRRIVRLHAREGESVRAGQLLLSLDSGIETADLQVALAKVESLRRELAIDQDVLKRQERLFAKDVDTEYAFTQAKLQAELVQSRLVLAEKEADLGRARLRQLELRSPVDGRIYKFDVRLGESLTADDASKIVLGAPELWVRLSVEAFWLDRVRAGDRYQVFDSETNAALGQGEVIFKAPYLGRRNFRTEDDQERFDTKYADVVLRLEGARPDIAMGQSVVAVLAPVAAPPS